MNPNKANTVINQLKHEPTAMVNQEGGLAYQPTDKKNLYLSVASWMVGEPTFYDKNDEEVIQLIQRVATDDMLFVLKLAEYVRNELNLRTAPQVMLVECSLIRDNPHRPLIKKYATKIIKRPDEMMTCVAYLKSRIGHIGDQSSIGSMPSSLKKGIAKVFGTFNEYSLQKYNNTRKEVKLLDVMRLVHPKPKSPEQSELFKKITTNSLKTPETWETIISKDGSNKESWIKASGIMGYMALLRNLRNFITNEVPLEKILSIITNPERIKKSKQFPFRFWSAYKEIAQLENIDATEVLEALESAMTISVNNIPKLSGRTFITSDNSGSMESCISKRSSTTLQEIGNLFLSMSSRFCEKSITSLFGQDHKIVLTPKSDGIISTVNRLNYTSVGHSTNGYKAIKHLLDNNINVDRIMVFTDMIMYDDSFYGTGKIREDSWRVYSTENFSRYMYEYRRKVNPNVQLYVFDLSGYGSLIMPEKDAKTMVIGGFSDKIFNLMKFHESDDWMWLDDSG